MGKPNSSVERTHRKIIHTVKKFIGFQVSKISITENFFLLQKNGYKIKDKINLNRVRQKITLGPSEIYLCNLF